MKAAEQYFPCNVYYAVQGGPNFWVCGWKSCGVTIQMQTAEQYFPVALSLCCVRWFYLLSLWIKSYAVTF